MGISGMYIQLVLLFIVDKNHLVWFFVQKYIYRYICCLCLDMTSAWLACTAASNSFLYHSIMVSFSPFSISRFFILLRYFDLIASTSRFFSCSASLFWFYSFSCRRVI